MQYIQLQQQPEGDIPNASANGSMNLFISNGCITLKDNEGHVVPQCGGGSALDNLQMELGWGSGETIGVNSERVRLLDINTNINDILTGTTGDEVWLYIERYKGKRIKTNLLDENIIREAQWKHETHPNEFFPDRPSEIRLTAATTNDFYFAQEQYFTISYNPIGKGQGVGQEGGVILSKGLGRGYQNRRSNVYLRFKLKIGSDANGWVYTKPLAKIQLMWEFQGTPGGYLPQLNYKYV
jgi:hypothetical protein